MTKTVLDIGNCNPDHASLKGMLTEQFGTEVLRAADLPSALEILGKASVDLIVVNRKLDIDYSDGIDVIKHLKQDSTLGKIPIMMITNYEEHQQQAVQMGALYGFGKSELRDSATRERLARILEL